VVVCGRIEVLVESIRSQTALGKKSRVITNYTGRQIFGY
jgi:hypothetical protein